MSLRYQDTAEISRALADLVQNIGPIIGIQSRMLQVLARNSKPHLFTSDHKLQV